MIEVACAILKNKSEQILLVQRAENMSHPLQWEFPGGKIEDDENPWRALQREIMEELQVGIENPRFLHPVRWSYGSKVIVLHPIICDLSGGELLLLEHKAFRWLHIEQIDGLSLLQADREILKQL